MKLSQVLEHSELNFVRRVAGISPTRWEMRSDLNRFDVV
jgi:hypothetical protein